MHYEVIIMHFKIRLLLPFICYILTGCSLVPDELKIAERIMDTHPDSALNILQNLNSEKYKSNFNNAFYNLLLFRAMEGNRKPLPPVALIDFSLTYFLLKKDKLHLAFCYYYKGHLSISAQRYDIATENYIKALECIQYHQDYLLLGKIYSDNGDICAFQRNYKESIKDYLTSHYYFKLVGDSIETKSRILDIGRIYRIKKKYKTAQRFYINALSQMKDSILCGEIYQEIGINYYCSKQFDSALYYLNKSLIYPSRGTSYAIRCYTLSDLLFDIKQYDSSSQYAVTALKHPANFHTQQECYRILVNVEYLRKDIKTMGKYMTLYQNCGDSIRKVESQTKSTVLEKLHNTTQEANDSKRNFVLIFSIMIVVLLVSTFLFFYLNKRNKIKKAQLEILKIQLNSKLEFVSRGLTKKIEETKAIQTDIRKNASAVERADLDRELYNTVLHLNDWDDFNREMNQAFNNIIITLKLNYPSITNKEIIWCCLNLMDIPHADRMLLLDVTSDSLYKLKQRLAQKLNLKSTKDLSSFLKDLSAFKD